MRSISVAAFFLVIFAYSIVDAGTDVPGNPKKFTYGDKGIIEIFGGLSINGNTINSSSFSFQAKPGINYFIARNVYIGSSAFVRIHKVLEQTTNYYDRRNTYRTQIDLGFGVPLGFAFKINENMYFNFVAPEFNFYLVDLKDFAFYPNFITSFKFPVDNVIINLGVEHNFFNVYKNQLSDPYYSYNVFISLSGCFETMKKGSATEAGRQAIDNPPGGNLISTSAESAPALSGKIAGGFFMSLLPLCSGSWIAGWDWGGLVFSVLKTTAASCLIGFIGRPSKVPTWVFGVGLFGMPIATVADAIYSPCRIAYRLQEPAAAEKPADDIKKNPGARNTDEPTVLFNAFPRLSQKKERLNKYNETSVRYMVDGVNAMVTRIF